jgi:hypothetical protein
MEQTGIPIDVEIHELIRDNRERLAIDLIKAKPTYVGTSSP